MSEQIESAVDQAAVETAPEKKGSGIGSTILGVGAAGTAGHFTAKYLQEQGIKEVLNPKVVEEGAKAAKVNEKMVARVENAFKSEKNGAALTAQKETVDALKSLDAKSVNEIHFGAAATEGANKGLHTAHFKTPTNTGGIKVEGLKLAEGAKAESNLIVEAAKNAEKITTGKGSYLNKTIASQENKLVKGIASESKYLDGLKSLSGKQKAIAVGVAIVAGIAVKSLTGRHASKENERRNDAQPAMAR